MDIPLLLEPEQLQEILDSEELLIVDLCNQEFWEDGHIPGAIHVAPSELISGQKPAPGMLPSEENLHALFSRIGYTPDKHIICYDDEGGGWAGRFIWTLDVIGHSRYSALNGGILAWRAAELEVSTEEEHPDPVNVSLTLNNKPIATKDDILRELDHTDTVIWDARSPAEFSGDKVLASRGGHIPGAINCDWTSLMEQDNSRRLRPDAAEHLASLGITPDKNIITHCQTHHRSGLTYLVGKILGFPNIRAYPGSWSEWGNLPDTPVEQG